MKAGDGSQCKSYYSPAASNSEGMKENKMMLVVRSLALSGAVMSLTASLVGQNVVTDWNSIASSTIVAHGGKSAGSAAVWFAYESIAVYDAINSIDRRFKPMYYDGRCDRDASEEAPAVALPTSL